MHVYEKEEDIYSRHAVVYHIFAILFGFRGLGFRV
jgi:hypothetical protein